MIFNNHHSSSFINGFFYQNTEADRRFCPAIRKQNNMGGIKDLLGFHFWLDNNKRGALESLLANQRQIPKDRQSILKDLAFEATNENKKLGKNHRK